MVEVVALRTISPEAETLLMSLRGLISNAARRHLKHFFEITKKNSFMAMVNHVVVIVKSIKHF